MVVKDNTVDQQTASADIIAVIKAAIAAGKLSKWAMPNEIRFVDQIAKTSVGKIDKKAIRTHLL